MVKHRVLLRVKNNLWILSVEEALNFNRGASLIYELFSEVVLSILVLCISWSFIKYKIQILSAADINITSDI